MRLVTLIIFFIIGFLSIFFVVYSNAGFKNKKLGKIFIIVFLTITVLISLICSIMSLKYMKIAQRIFYIYFITSSIIYLIVYLINFFSQAKHKGIILDLLLILFFVLLPFSISIFSISKVVDSLCIGVSNINYYSGKYKKYNAELDFYYYEVPQRILFVRKNTKKDLANIYLIKCNYYYDINHRAYDGIYNSVSFIENYLDISDIRIIPGNQYNIYVEKQSYTYDRYYTPGSPTTIYNLGQNYEKKTETKYRYIIINIEEISN